MLRRSWTRLGVICVIISVGLYICGILTRPASTDMNTRLTLQEEIINLCTELNKASKPYWLEQDTLLGAALFGDVLNHTRSVHIGYLWVDRYDIVSHTGTKFGLGGMELIKHNFQGYTVDQAGLEKILYPLVNRRKGLLTQTITGLLQGKYFVFGSTLDMTILDRFIHWIFVALGVGREGIPYEWIFPLHKVGGSGPFKHCNIVSNPEQLVKIRMES
eukprot:m.8786 g.8786  ORF g.8786 m.8786 type:complete len:217 (+) comp3956_c0_seq1:409-1059(+)